MQIGGLVPGEDVPAPAAPPIGFAQRFTKGEHAVKPLKVEPSNRYPFSQLIEAHNHLAEAFDNLFDLVTQGMSQEERERWYRLRILGR